MALDKIRFETNRPVELALKFTEGKLCDSAFGDPQYLFTTLDDRCFFVAEKVAQKIHGLRLQPGEPIDVCKAEVDYGRGRKGIEWQISRVGEPPAAPEPSASPAPSAGMRAAQKFWQGKAGDQPDGTFVMPAPAPNGAPNGNSKPNGSNGHAAPPALPPEAPAPQERPKTRLEDALKTVIAAVHAANEYAKSIGYAIPQFTSEDLRTMANTLVIDMGRGGK